MNAKIAALVALAAFVLLASAADARFVTYRNDNGEDRYQLVSPAGHRPLPVAASERALSHKQGRVFPGAVAIKKLVLLKFKKVIPISLILLKSNNENEAELVPVYPTSEIPADVQFIPTPNGISGHKDVQAIAIPTELHQQLEANGLANIENIQALLDTAQEEEEEHHSGPTNQVAAVIKDDELLNIKEDDEDQLLEGTSNVEKPRKTTTAAAAAAATAAATAAAVSATATTNLRRLAAEEFRRSGLRGSPQTAVEEIPLYLYSAKDTPQLPYRGQHAVHPRRQHA